MNAIAAGDPSVGPDPQAEPWRTLLAEVHRQLRELAAHPARSVVLLPFAQLLPLAARLWAQAYPDGFAPRFDILSTFGDVLVMGFGGAVGVVAFLLASFTAHRRR